MSKRPVVLLIDDIWEALGKVDLYVGSLSLEDFLADNKTVDAVIRNIEILGEAVSGASKALGYGKDRLTNLIRNKKLQRKTFFYYC